MVRPKVESGKTKGGSVWRRGERCEKERENIKVERRKGRGATLCEYINVAQMEEYALNAKGMPPPIKVGAKGTFWELKRIFGVLV